jgi:pimeloyl-ACP methyl ester carboxylesterase
VRLVQDAAVAGLTEADFDIGGRRLHAVHAGSGDPTVIFEAGSGCSSEIWRAVQGQVADLTTTYSYDRAGLGSSDPSGPWSLASWVADLEAWLAAAQAGPPYLLVGHSLGGHVVRAFADRHRREVVGMVLVDARHEDLYPTLPRAFLARLAELLPEDSARANQADGLIRTMPAASDLPLTVITHGRADWIPAAFGLTQDDLDAAELAWQQFQAKLAACSTRAKLCVAASAGHLISVDQPEIVVSEIRAMLDGLGQP